MLPGVLVCLVHLLLVPSDYHTPQQATESEQAAVIMSGHRPSEQLLNCQMPLAVLVCLVHLLLAPSGHRGMLQPASASALPQYPFQTVS